MHQQKSNRSCRFRFLFLLAVTIVLLPVFIARINCSLDDVVLEVTTITEEYGGYSARIKTVIRNEGKVTFNEMEGDIDIYRDDVLLYSCSCVYNGKMTAGKEIRANYVENDWDKAEVLLTYPPKELSYTWTPTAVRFVSMGIPFVRSLDPERQIPWIAVVWLILAAGTLAAGIAVIVKRKYRTLNEPQEYRTAEPSSLSGGYVAGPDDSYGTGSVSYAREEHYESAGENANYPSAAHSSIDRDALDSAQRRLENASWRSANYRTQGLTENAENAEHQKRTAYGRVLRESAGLNGRDRQAFDSAENSYEYASLQESSYRAQGQKDNAEEARHRRESAYGGMLQAVANKDGRRSPEFDSARNRYDYASREAASYRRQGLSDNAEEAEHRMRVAHGEMLKNTSDLSRSESRAYSSAQSSYEYASRQAANYRKQGLTQNAESSEHRMRLAEAEMLRIKAESKGNGRAFNDARKDFENASRRYSEYKSQGREADANREKDFMERAHAKMMQNI